MKHRQLPDRGYCDPSALPKGPNGRALCRYCGTEVPPGKRTFCSPACIHEWKIRSQPDYAAKQVLLRDCGVCGTCGLDCIVLRQQLTRMRADELRTGLTGSFTAELDRLGLRGARRNLTQRLWEVDHTLPVSQGGGSCGLDNLRTLCWACHARVTATLARVRASLNRIRR